MTDRLGHKETAAMFTLMVLGRQVRNPELVEVVGFSLVGKERRLLNDRGLVESSMVSGAFAHELTDPGWAWCANELAMPALPQAKSLGTAFYVVLGGLGRYLQQERLSLAKVFAPKVEVTPAEVEDHVRAVYQELAPAARDWVRLVDLRAKLGPVPREDVDAVLRKLSKNKQAHLVPESNRKALGAADHEAAIRVGGEDNHLISIEAS
jgi:hypothetical protein